MEKKRSSRSRPACATKSVRSAKQKRDVFAHRAIEHPDAYTPEELEILVHYGLQFGRGLMKNRETANFGEQAEAFRRRFEIITIFKRLPERLRKRPCGETTIDAVLDRLKENGITISEMTLLRDYRHLGGAKVLRSAKPFAPKEDQTSALQAYRGQRPPRRRAKVAPEL